MVGKHRPAAPDAITDDFEEAKNLLAVQPGVGARSISRKYPDLRRLFSVPRQVPYLLSSRFKQGCSPRVLARQPRGRPKLMSADGRKTADAKRDLSSFPR